MPFVANFPFFTILFTMAGGVICSILKGERAYKLNLIITTLCTALSLSLLLYMHGSAEQITYLMGHFPAPWGNEIRFGPLEALIATVLSFVMLMVIIAEKDSVIKNVNPNKVNLFYLMMNMMLSSLYALIYTNDLFTSYVFIEINTLCACGFIMAKENGKTIAATIKYLIMSLLGSGLFLVSIILLYDLTGHLLMPNVHENLMPLIESGSYQLPITIIAGLLAVGIAIKSALFPFHAWMSHAYNNAMNASNAISSGLVVKGYIILLIKIYYRVFGLDTVSDLGINNVLLIFGVMAIIVGSVDAVREDNIKRMLAYSSVGQIGYIYTGIAFATSGGMLAACYIIVYHSLVKSMMFLSCEGLMTVSNNSKYTEDLRGSGYHNKIAGIAFTAGGLSMIGIPLFSGFMGKYLLILGAPVDWRIAVVIVAIAISTVLNALYFTKYILCIYAKPNKKHEKYIVKGNYKFSLGLLLIVNILLGFMFDPIINIINTGLQVL